MQVRTLMGTLSRPAVAQDAARRATQQEVAVREGRAHDERDPHQGIDEAGASIVPHRQDDAHGPHERQDHPRADGTAGRLEVRFLCRWGRLRR